MNLSFLGAINSFQVVQSNSGDRRCLMIEEIAGYSLRISSGYRKRILYDPTNISSRYSDCDISQRITSIINSHLANDCARLHTNDTIAYNGKVVNYYKIIIKNEILTLRLHMLHRNTIYFKFPKSTYTFLFQL